MIVPKVFIGATVWDYHVGALTPGQIEVEKKTNNDGSVQLKNTAKRSEITGQLTTTITVPDESDAVALAEIAGLYQGARIQVAIEGVVFSGARVDRSEVRWQRQRCRNGYEWLVTGAWSFGPAQNDSHDDPKDIYIPGKVETGNEWGTWTEQKHLVATKCTKVFGPVGAAIGSAEVVMMLNPDAVDENGDPDPTANTVPDIGGHYLRISLPEGTPEEIANATEFKKAWHGVIVNRAIGSDRGRVVVTWQALDPSFLLDTFLTYFYEEQEDGSVVDPGEVLPFNYIEGGEESADTPGPRGTYVHDRTRSVGNKWRNDRIAALILAAYDDEFLGGPGFTLTGQAATALGNFQKHDLDGGTVRDMLGQLICRGIGATVDVNDNDDVELRVTTGIRNAISAGGWTVPASDQQAAVDLHDLDDLVGWNFDDDYMQLADKILNQHAQPWYCLSLGINDDDDKQLRKTWSGSDATFWNTLDEKSRNAPQYAHVWRRYRLDKAWKGATYKNSANEFKFGRLKTTDATHGDDGENGNFGDTIRSTFPWAGCRFTKNLPISIGEDWTQDMTSGGPGITPRDALDRPTLYAVSDPGGAGEEWTRLDMEITLDDEWPEVTLGRDAKDAEKLRDLLQDDQHLVLTVGMRIPRPWRFGWRRAPAAQRRDADRTVLYQRPDIEYRYLVNETIVGVDEDGQPELSQEGVIGEKPEIGIQLLPVGRLVHENSQRGLTWTRQRIDLTNQQPGTFITETQLPYGTDADPDDDEGPSQEVTVDAPVTVKSWNLDRANPSTTWSTMRLATDVVIEPKPTPNPPKVVDLSHMVYNEG